MIAPAGTTGAAGVEEAHVVPLLVKRLPDVPGAIICNADVPLPSKA